MFVGVPSPVPAVAPLVATPIPAVACSPAPPFPATLIAKATPAELLILSQRAEVNTSARKTVQAACKARQKSRRQKH